MDYISILILDMECTLNENFCTNRSDKGCGRRKFLCQLQPPQINADAVKVLMESNPFSQNSDLQTGGDGRPLVFMCPAYSVSRYDYDYDKTLKL